VELIIQPDVNRLEISTRGQGHSRLWSSQSSKRRAVHERTLSIKEERRMISERTKAALAAAKKRGVKLGGYRAGAEMTAKIRKAGNEANAQKAAQRAVDIAPIIADLQAAGATSLQAI
jgi:hypothetical protein